ncbi:c-type cytochrome [Oceanisphaera pacifica]|uniref:Cytochrome c n=1 Tax=Oceanisphaera pacifica TaxID=2818389 RepID=A0ABS3NGR6_9GAMM|nr:cytochrome c [Oceanisphaera pacifica]MBO1519588.1 cytochrome c [Oceanisphaera pacifica]
MLKKIALVAMGGLFATTAMAQSDLFKADDLVKYRQSIYQVMSAQATVLGAMAKGDTEFDAEAVHERALNLGNVSKLLGETYVPATKGVKDSNLLDSAWDDLDGMGEKGKAFGGALQELIAVSGEEGFDKKAAAPAIVKVLKSCKACHDDYRAD